MRIALLILMMLAAQAQAYPAPRDKVEVLPAPRVAGPDSTLVPAGTIYRFGGDWWLVVGYYRGDDDVDCSIEIPLRRWQDGVPMAWQDEPYRYYKRSQTEWWYRMGLLEEPR